MSDEALSPEKVLILLNRVAFALRKMMFPGVLLHRHSATFAALTERVTPEAARDEAQWSLHAFDH